MTLVMMKIYMLMITNNLKNEFIFIFFGFIFYRRLLLTAISHATCELACEFACRMRASHILKREFMRGAMCAYLKKPCDDVSGILYDRNNSDHYFDVQVIVWNNDIG